MALVKGFVCLKCGQFRFDILNVDNICSDCQENDADKQRRMHFAMLKGLTIEERLDRIEKELYALNIQNRLKNLESKNATY